MVNRKGIICKIKMKRKIRFAVFFILILFLTIILYNSKIFNRNSLLGNDDFESLFKRDELTVGILFEKYPYIYLNLDIIKTINDANLKDLNLSYFSGIEIDIFKNLFKNKIIKFDIIKSNNENYKNYDIICGGIIKSKYSDNFFNDTFFSINYLSDRVYLIKNKNSKSIKIRKLLENKIPIGVKLYSLAYYILEETANIKKYSFYEDLLNGINSKQIEYALIDSHDFKFFNINKYPYLELVDIVYQEDYVFYFNKKYIKDKIVLEEKIKTIIGDN